MTAVQSIIFDHSPKGEWAKEPFTFNELRRLACSNERADYRDYAARELTEMVNSGQLASNALRRLGTMMRDVHGDTVSPHVDALFHSIALKLAPAPVEPEPLVVAKAPPKVTKPKRKPAASKPVSADSFGKPKATLRSFEDLPAFLFRVETAEQPAGGVN